MPKGTHSDTVCKSGREPSPEPQYADMMSQISILQNREKINFCCLSPLVYGIFLWQPKHINKNTFCARHNTMVLE